MSESRQRGMVLVTSLLLLVVVTILAVSMFRSFGIDEKIAGNVREKARALGAAETAEQYAEYWLSQGNGSTGITCAAPAIDYTVGQVCSNPLTFSAAAAIPWVTQVNYLPTTPNLMPVSTSGGSNTYYQTPGFYISYIGLQPGGLGSIYQIDAVGYGGSPNSVAVVESTYLVQTNIKDLGAL